ncbi:MFS transporter [bacterium]|nr:MFS transporter [bacterium]
MTTKDFRQNFLAFIWHALFLAFASIFIDVNTVLPSLLLNIGGSSIHIGFLTGISIGLPMIAQLFFAAFLAGRTRKKPYLLLGIYLRVLALAGMGYTLAVSSSSDPGEVLLMVFLGVGLFAVSGAFAGVSYTDLLGKIFIGTQREKFLVFKQLITALGMLASALIARHLVTSLAFPQNYALFFFLASGLLCIATFGFMMIKEDSIKKDKSHGVLAVIKTIPKLLKSDKNLRNYIVLINLISLGLTTIPFYVVYSKSLFGLTAEQVGNFLLFQFLGMIFSTLIWQKVAKHFRFKGLAYISIAFGCLIPVLVLFLANYGINVFQWIFFIAGFFISAYMIFLQGMLLEISDNENRAVYAGISGTLSLTAVIFPLVAGVLIESFGFFVIFVSISPLIFSSIFFLRNIECLR